VESLPVNALWPLTSGTSLARLLQPSESRSGLISPDLSKVRLTAVSVKPTLHAQLLPSQTPHFDEILTDSVAHTGDSAAEPDPVPGRDARMAYSDQAATDAITSGVVNESATYHDATANGNV
jgi:hypothetical protein